jgi:tripartite ATP-independent transporter DctP family solute receptor
MLAKVSLRSYGERIQLVHAGGRQGQWVLVDSCAPTHRPRSDRPGPANADTLPARVDKTKSSLSWEETMSATKAPMLAAAVALGLAISGWATDGPAEDVRHYRFAYDQPHNTGYGLAADIFAAKLAELSKGALVVDQYPGAQLGQEPQLLQLIKSGDVDFGITSSANTATVCPEAGVMSLHFLFRSEDHLKKALADPKVVKAMREMIDETVQGAHAIALATLGLRNMYSKKEIHKVDDMKGLKVRVQATATEDAMFPAYGAQTVHMPFGSVYTSLQTGVVDVAENGVNVYLVNKHYEVAPVLSMTQHEANNSLIWVSDKLWVSLSVQQKQWVQAAADEVGRVQPGKAMELEHQSEAKLKSIGVKVIGDVDKSGFVKIAQPHLDRLAQQLGPRAVKVEQQRAVQ